jgi:cytochrome c oxidase subunit 1
MAYYDYSNPALSADALAVVASVIGGGILVVSGALFIIVLVRGHLAPRVEPPEYRFSVAVHPSRTVPAALNGYGLWVGLMIMLTLINYGFPILQLMFRSDTSVPVVHIGASR